MATYVNSEPKPKFPLHPSPVQSPGPVDKLESRIIRGVPIELEYEIKVLLSDSITATDEDAIPDIVNNDLRLPINTDGCAIGTVIEEEGVLYVQKCLMGECYYKSCDLYDV